MASFETPFSKISMKYILLLVLSLCVFIVWSWVKANSFKHIIYSDHFQSPYFPFLPSHSPPFPRLLSAFMSYKIHEWREKTQLFSELLLEWWAPTLLIFQCDSSSFLGSLRTISPVPRTIRMCASGVWSFPLCPYPQQCLLISFK